MLKKNSQNYPSIYAFSVLRKLEGHVAEKDFQNSFKKIRPKHKLLSLGN
jgi:hypothetical protein